jgi:hypothetical protein
MKRVLQNSDSSKIPSLELSEMGKRIKTRQDSLVRKIFESCMSKCSTLELTPSHISEFIHLKPDLTLLTALFKETVKSSMPLNVRYPLLSYTLNQVHSRSELLELSESNQLEVKDGLKEIFTNRLREQASDSTLFSLLDKLLVLNLSTEEIVSLSLESIKICPNHKETNTALVAALQNKEPSIEDLHSLIIQYLQKDSVENLTYRSLSKVLIEMLLKKNPPLTLLESIIQVAVESHNSNDLVPTLLDGFLEKSPHLDSLLKIANLPKILSLPEQLIKLTKSLAAAFIRESNDPDLREFSLKSFEEHHPSLYTQFISWIARFEKGLIYTDDFKSESTRGAFTSSIINILKFALENEEFRSYCSTELTEALSTCKDQASLFVNNLLLQKEVIEARDKPLAEMIPIFKRKVAVEILREFSKSYVAEQDLILATNPEIAGNEEWILAMRPDAVVVQLDLECRLREKLNLRGVITKHLFGSNLTERDTEEALSFVRSILSNPGTLATRLVQPEAQGTKSIWVQEMLKMNNFRLKAQVIEKQAPLFALQEILDLTNPEEERNTALEEGEIDETLKKAQNNWRKEFNKLPISQKNFFLKNLEEGPVETLYSRRSRCMLELFDFVESEVVRLKTLEILRNL